MTNKTTAFKTACRVLRMKQEYPGYTGDILWIIVSDLTEEQILERYPEEVKPYTPFVHMTREMYAPITAYENNRLKFYYRDRDHGDAYGYEDGDFECYHPEMIVNPFDDDGEPDVQSALATLNEVQRRRIIKRFFMNMTIVEIAEEEHATKQAVFLSIQHALKNLKRFFEQA